MLSDYEVRRVRAEDLLQIIEIADNELGEEYDPRLFSHLYEGFKGGFMVAVRGDELLGFILGIPLDNTSLRILMLAVRTQYLRMGVGTSLLEECRQYARIRGMTSIRLEVRRENVTAISFYTRSGFSTTKVLDDFYTDGSSALVMTHFLSI